MAKKMMAAFGLAASVGLLASPAAALEPTEMPSSYDAGFDAAMKTAWLRAAETAPTVMSRLSPQERLAAQTDFMRSASLQAIAPGQAFLRQDVEAGLAPDAASFGADVAYVERDLKAQGLANEAQAKASPIQARWGQPPKLDAEGYYFTWYQTFDYAHTEAADRMGVYPAAYYRDLRCRAAPRIGPFAQEPRWDDWSLRVCPDAEGKYRPAV